MHYLMSVISPNISATWRQNAVAVWNCSLRFFASKFDGHLISSVEIEINIFSLKVSGDISLISNNISGIEVRAFILSGYICSACCKL